MRRTGLIGPLVVVLALAAPRAFAWEASDRPRMSRTRLHRHAPPWHHHPAPRRFPKNAEQPEQKPAYRNRSSLSTDPSSDGAGVIAGTAYIPVLLVDFADRPARADVHEPSDYADMLFRNDYQLGAGSMRDYFQDQSGGLFDVTGEVTPWLRLPRSHSTYAGTSYGFQTSEPNNWSLVKDAVAAADATVDFCRGDTDRDGFVDTLFLIHAGAGAEETGEGIWSIRWKLMEPLATADVCADGRAVKISDFVVEPEEYASDRYTPDGAPDRMISIGMFVHEFGHALGLPDLYDIDASTAGGVGAWDVMAGGAWGFHGMTPWQPTPLSAWSKIQLGWASPQVITENKTSLSIASADRPHEGVFTGLHKLIPPGSSSEYFLIENREPVGWASEFPVGGLAVWHVDESQRRLDNTDNAVDGQRLVSLVQADGLDELGAPGSSAAADAGDLFPGSANSRGVADNTVPSLKLNSGTNSSLSIQSIGDPGSSVTIDVFVGIEPRDAPVPPRELTAKAALEGDISLDWEPSETGGVDSYRVYRKTFANSYSWIATVGGNITSFQDDSVSAGVSYEYRVRAFNSIESADSNPANATAPAPVNDSGFSPTRFVLKRASQAIGSMEALRYEDGNNLTITAARAGASYKLVYVAVMDVSSLDLARLPRRATLDLAVTAPLKSVNLYIFNTRSRSWTKLGTKSASPGFLTRVSLPDSGSFLTTSSRIRFRFASEKSTLFSHQLDKVALVVP